MEIEMIKDFCTRGFFCDVTLLSRKVPDIVGSISAGRRAWNLAITVVATYFCFDKTYFSYKIAKAVKVKNYLNIIINSPFFPQLLLLMQDATQWVLSTKFPVVWEFQVVKFECCNLPYKHGMFWYFQLWWLVVVTPKPLVIL